MSVNYDLNNTGPEVQERLDQVLPNRDNIDAERARAVSAEQTLQGNIDAETQRAQSAERNLQQQIDTKVDPLGLSVVGGRVCQTYESE